MKKLRNILLWTSGTLSGIVLATATAMHISPKPGAFLIKQLFDRPYGITNPEAYDKVADGVTLVKDLNYQSVRERNQYDVYLPTDLSEGEQLPVVFWVHGGGFVGGDKSQMVELATYLVAKGRVAFVAFNYALAPNAKYPSQLEQLNEAIKHVARDEDLLEILDFNRLVFGGDSAGAQIAGQYVLLQTNAAYRHSLGYRRSLDSQQIKGFISYCGPLAMSQMATIKHDSPMLRFFYDTVSRSMIGSRQWSERAELFEASLVDHVQADFPVSFITDGNSHSFESQGLAFVEKLKTVKVPVRSLFYSDTDEELIHEYQFAYQTQAAQDCLAQTVAFLKDILD